MPLSILRGVIVSANWTLLDSDKLAKNRPKIKSLCDARYNTPQTAMTAAWFQLSGAWNVHVP